MTKGYRTTPWRSPYLRWRVETWSGIPADSMGPGTFSIFLGPPLGYYSLPPLVGAEWGVTLNEGPEAVL